MEFKRFVAAPHIPHMVMACQVSEEMYINTINGQILVFPGEWVVKDSLGLCKISDYVFRKLYTEMIEEFMECGERV